MLVRRPRSPLRDRIKTAVPEIIDLIKPEYRGGGMGGGDARAYIIRNIRDLNKLVAISSTRYQQIKSAAKRFAT